MTAKPTIYFDLDGTIYPLYDQPDWLERITTLADPSAYAAEVMMVDEVALQEVLLDLISEGFRVGVVSWLAKDATPEYDRAVRAVKREYIKKFLPMATEIHIVKYGTKKHSVIKNPHNAIIVDDDAGVRKAWTRGDTIDATGDILSALGDLLYRSRMSEWEIVARILANSTPEVRSGLATESEAIQWAQDRARGL